MEKDKMTGLYPSGEWPVGTDLRYIMRYDPDADPHVVRVEWEGTCYIDINIEGDDYDLILADADTPVIAEGLFDEDLLDGMNCYHPYLLFGDGGKDEMSFDTEVEAIRYADEHPMHDWFLQVVDGKYYSEGMNHIYDRRI